MFGAAIVAFELSNATTSPAVAAAAATTQSLSYSAMALYHPQTQFGGIELSQSRSTPNKIARLLVFFFCLSLSLYRESSTVVNSGK